MRHLETFKEVTTCYIFARNVFKRRASNKQDFGEKKDTFTTDYSVIAKNSRQGKKCTRFFFHFHVGKETAAKTCSERDFWQQFFSLTLVKEKRKKIEWKKVFEGVAKRVLILSKMGSLVRPNKIFLSAMTCPIFITSAKIVIFVK